MEGVGHFKKSSTLLNANLQQPTPQTPNLQKTPATVCPQCKRGKHWMNSCRSKFDISGNLLPPLDVANTLSNPVPFQGNRGRSQPQAPIPNGAPGFPFPLPVAISITAPMMLQTQVQTVPQALPRIHTHKPMPITPPLVPVQCLSASAMGGGLIDFCSTLPLSLLPREQPVLAPNGVKGPLPNGHNSLILGRASLALKGVIVHTVLIHVNTTDEICLVISTKSPIFIEPGEPICQLLLLPALWPSAASTICTRPIGNTSK